MKKENYDVIQYKKPTALQVFFIDPVDKANIGLSSISIHLNL